MEIRNLISFVHVAELGSFTKAAQTLGYSQSTVSFQIKQLESELDCLLFERINHTITLTDRGKELLNYAQDISRLTDEFKQSFSYDKEISGFIHIVTPDSICEAMLLEHYLDFHSKYPGIDLKFTTADTDDMFDMLERNEADVIMTLDTHVYRKDFVIAKEEHVDMHFVTGVNSPFADKKNLSIKDIADCHFLLTEKSMGYRKVLDKEFAKKSIDVTPQLEVGRTDIIAKLLQTGNGVSFLPDFVSDELVKQGKLVYLDVCDIEANVWKQLIYHKNKWISRCLNAFLEYVKNVEFGD